jgi:betaine-aldehyde dehydrogenase
MEQHKMIIGGEAVTATHGSWDTLIDPATEAAIAEVPQAYEADVNKAIAAAQSAFTTWSKTTPAERSLLLHKP